MLPYCRISGVDASEDMRLNPPRQVGAVTQMDVHHSALPFHQLRQPHTPRPDLPRIHYHEVEVSSYPLFQYQPYCLALASRMAEVAECYNLDVLHVHYAIPHSISAMLAQQMLAPTRRLPFITTLHGTDITLVGVDPSYFPITKFSIERSDGITAVSDDLRRADAGSVRRVERNSRDQELRQLRTLPSRTTPRRAPPSMRRPERNCCCTCRTSAR